MWVGGEASLDRNKICSRMGREKLLPIKIRTVFGMEPMQSEWDIWLAQSLPAEVDGLIIYSKRSNFNSNSRGWKIKRVKPGNKSQNHCVKWNC